ncbi:thioesterase II family protein [Actinophytocola sp.]|uniref:thioesterase II family protein n=1 Tax=Actinophytocola sp. TaxID=1872138 RepID=UPI002ED6BB57
MPAPRWLLCRRRVPDAALRLYCFPHSGASPGEYLRWSDQLPDLEVVGVQAPGRGGRIAETPYTRMSDLVHAVATEAAFAPPFAFFGHSLGALLAFEVARALRTAGRPQPALLFVSALGAPDVQPLRPPTHQLDDDRLLATVAGDGGQLPAIIDQDAEMRRIVLACVRADATVLDTYRHAPAPPLDMPVIALGGADDQQTPYLAGWAGHTTNRFDLHVLPGGHFYLREHHDDVVGVIRESVDRSRRATGAERR